MHMSESSRVIMLDRNFLHEVTAYLTGMMGKGGSKKFLT